MNSIIAIMLALIWCLPLNGTTAEDYWHLVQSLQTEGDMPEARSVCQQLLKRHPEHLEALMFLGIDAYQQGTIHAARSYFERRLLLAPTCAQTQLFCGMTYALEQQFDTALHHYGKAIEHHPESSKAWGVQAIAYEKTNRPQEALASYERALTLDPQNIEWRHHVATLLVSLERYSEAIVHYDYLIARSPEHTGYLLSRAELCTNLGRYEEASWSYQKLIEQKPDDIAVLVHAAKTFIHAGNWQEARDIYQKLLSTNPNNTSLHFELARLDLAHGNSADGYKHLYLSNTPTNNQLTDLSQAAGNTILVGAEWLHEDMLHFLRYVPVLKALGGFVVVQTPQALKTLIRDCPYVDHVLCVEKKEFRPYDFFIPITSLAHLVHQSELKLPNGPHLRANSQFTQQWAAALPRSKTLNIGVHLKNNSDLSLDRILTLLPPSSNLFILAVDVGYEALQHSPPDQYIRCFGKGFAESEEDINNLAAMITQLDALITTDGTVAHLAAGLGCTTFLILDNKTVHWRWTTDELAQQRYPSVTIVRQEQNGIWPNLTHIKDKLSALTACAIA